MDAGEGNISWLLRESLVRNGGETRRW